MIIAYKGEKPLQATPGSAGYDLVIAKGKRLKKGEFAFLETKTRIQMPPGIFAEVRPRSSAPGRGMWIFPGIIDSDYTGIIKIGVWAMKDITVKAGERIAQLVFHSKLDKINFREYNIPETGHKGFGSTGGYHANRPESNNN